MINKYLWIWILILIIPSSANNNYPYQWNTWVDAVLFPVGIAFGLSGSYYFQKKNITVDPNNIEENLDYLNTWVSKQYSPMLSTMSDWGLYALGVAPIVVEILRIKQTSMARFWTEMLMYAQVITFSSSLNLWVRSLIINPRPFVYNKNVSLEKRKQGESQRSFYSGHASGAFATSVFLNRQLRLTFKSKDVFWFQVFNLTVATGISSLRVFSGKHFWQDVVVGGLSGGFISWLIPWLHHKEDVNWSFLIRSQMIIVQYSFDSL